MTIVGGLVLGLAAGFLLGALTVTLGAIGLVTLARHLAEADAAANVVAEAERVVREAAK